MPNHLTDTGPGGVPMKGTIDTKSGVISFTPVSDKSDESKFAKRLQTALDSMSFSMTTLAGIIVYSFPPILQRKMWWLIQALLDRWAAQWDAEEYDPDLADVVQGAACARDSLKASDLWEG